MQAAVFRLEGQNYRSKDWFVFNSFSPKTKNVSPQKTQYRKNCWNGQSRDWLVTDYFSPFENLSVWDWKLKPILIPEAVADNILLTLVISHKPHLNFSSDLLLFSCNIQRVCEGNFSIGINIVDNEKHNRCMILWCITLSFKLVHKINVVNLLMCPGM